MQSQLTDDSIFLISFTTKVDKFLVSHKYKDIQKINLIDSKINFQESLIYIYDSHQYFAITINLTNLEFTKDMFNIIMNNINYINSNYMDLTNINILTFLECVDYLQVDIDYSNIRVNNIDEDTLL